MSIKFVVLIRAEPSRDMMEDRRSDNRLCVRQRTSRRTKRLGCIGRVHSFGASRKGNGVCERDEDQSECDQAPAVVLYVVEFEVIGSQVGLRGRAEPYALLVKDCDAEERISYSQLP
jgi:hypothetical protein